jgi:hypothetical protein
MLMKYVAFVLLALGLAAPANAEYGWCTIQKDGSYDTYVTEVIDIGTGPDVYSTVLTGQFGRAFQGYVRQFETVVREPDCHSSKRLSDAQDGNRRYGGSVGKVIRTNWRGTWPAPTEGAASAQSGAYLTVKSDDSASRSAKVADDAMLKAQRDAAAALAKRIADSARADAEMQAGIKKFLADLRKRGRAQ